MGNSGPIHGKYICPDHIAIIRDHKPGWITDEEPITGMRCKCGWEWTPQERSPAGVPIAATTGSGAGPQRKSARPAG